MEKGAIFLLAIMVLCVVLAPLMRALIFGSVVAYFFISLHTQKPLPEEKLKELFQKGNKLNRI
jgi:MFS superfamily sulfate permease-like transporter